MFAPSDQQVALAPRTRPRYNEEAAGVYYYSSWTVLLPPRRPVQVRVPSVAIVAGARCYRTFVPDVFFFFLLRVRIFFLAPLVRRITSGLTVRAARKFLETIHA